MGILVLLGLLLSTTQADIHIKPGCLAPDSRHTDLWCPGDAGYECYKIPSLLKVPASSTLLAFIEARKHSCDDEGYVDLLLRRSHDNGQTWGDAQFVWGNSTDVPHQDWHTIGDALPIHDRATGAIHLVFTSDNKDALYMRSDDLGATWPAVPRNISSDAAAARGPFLGTGHAAGLQLDNGTLLVPMYGGGSNSFVLASSDHGDSWAIRSELDCAPNEWVMAETAEGSGRLVGSVRSEGTRLQAFSPDGGRTWTPTQHAPGLPEPVSGCEGAMVLHPNGRLYYSHPDEKLLRQKMNIKVSADGGKSWRQHVSLWGPGAGCDAPCVPAASYSSMVVLDEGNPASDIAILYMRNNVTMFIFEGRGVSYTTFAP